MLLLVGLVLWFKNADLQSAIGNTALVHDGLTHQLQAMGRSTAFVATRLIAPFRLSILYPSAGSIFGLIELLLVAVLLISLYQQQAKRGKGLFVAVAIFALLVATSLSWFDSSRFSVVSDGTAYLAMVPLISVVIFAASNAISKANLPSAAPLVGLSAVLLVALAAPAWLRTHTFESQVALWSDTLEKNPDSVLAETSLAEQLRLRALADSADQDKQAMDADFAAAIEHAKAALTLDPNNAKAQHTWASALVAQGDDAAALQHFQAAIKSDPDNPQIRAEYGSALVTLGRFKEAIPQLDQALVQDFASGVAHRLLGKAYFGLGNIDRAITEEQTALSITPTDSVARELLGDAQAKAGKLKDAIESYVNVLSDPAQKTRADIWMDIARIKDRQGDYDLSVQYMQTAQKLTHDALERANTEQEKALATPLDEQTSKALTAEIEKQKWAASTRPTTRSATEPAATQPAQRN